MLAKTGNEIRKRGHKTGESDKTTATGNLYGNWTDGLAEREREISRSDCSADISFPPTNTAATLDILQLKHDQEPQRTGNTPTQHRRDSDTKERTHKLLSFFSLCPSTPSNGQQSTFSIKKSDRRTRHKTPHRNRWLKTTRNRIEIKRGISCE